MAVPTEKAAWFIGLTQAVSDSDAKKSSKARHASKEFYDAARREGLGPFQMIKGAIQNLPCEGRRLL